MPSACCGNTCVIWRSTARTFAGRQPSAPTSRTSPVIAPVIELDGGQHNEARGIAADAKRTAELNARGYRVLRFWNNDVLTNVEGVMETIAAAVRDARPPPPH